MRISLLALLGVLLTASVSAASLEHGHVRARTRGFVYDPNNPEGGSGRGEDGSDAGAASSQAGDEIVVTADPYRVNGEDLEKGPGLGERARRVARSGVSFGANLVRLGGGRSGEDLRLGYLTQGPPNPLRFSDRDAVKSRPVAPALPEVTFSAEERVPYLIERPLPEDAANDPAMLSELVIELEPHEITSGTIDTRVKREQEQQIVEGFELEEQRSTALRPEEVLIFFETTTPHGDSSGAVIPFAPALPAPNAVNKSSAKLIKE